MSKLEEKVNIDRENIEASIKETIEFNDDEFRNILLEKLYDLKNLSRNEYLEKYGITERQYRRHKRDFVLIYGVEPRHLYDSAHLKYLVEFHPFIDDKKYSLPLEDQLVIPTSVMSTNNYLSKKRTVEIDKSGNITRVWLKQDLIEKEWHNAFIKAIKTTCKEIKPLPVIKPPISNNKDLLTFYPLPDLHFGVLASKIDTEYDYDLKLATEWFNYSVDYLFKTSPDSETCVICDLGDFLHSSTDGNRTKSGHELDVDTRHSKIVQVAFENMRFMLEKALQKHKKIYFYSVPGNHSEYISIYLKEFLRAWFKDNKRVIIPNTNKAQQYFVFGKNILGFTHGHELKPEKCAEVMVYDNQKIFSETKYRYYHFGHFHNYRAFSTPLVNIEVHNNMPPRDYWAESMGYRGEVGLTKSITYHIEDGERSRNICNIPLEIKKNLRKKDKDGIGRKTN